MQNFVRIGSAVTALQMRD